jgi:hypothetical protein
MTKMRLSLLRAEGSVLAALPLHWSPFSSQLSVWQHCETKRVTMIALVPLLPSRRSDSREACWRVAPTDEGPVTKREEQKENHPHIVRQEISAERNRTKTWLQSRRLLSPSRAKRR